MTYEPLGAANEPTGVNPRRVLVIADDEEACLAVLEGLRAIPSRCVAVCAEAAELEPALREISTDSEDRPHLAILDVSGGAATVECVAVVRGDDPGRLVPIVALMHRDDPYLAEAIRAGANAVLDRGAVGGSKGAVSVAAEYWLRHNLVLRVD